VRATGDSIILLVNPRWFPAARHKCHNA
jgi:hypothetical protein